MNIKEKMKKALTELMIAKAYVKGVKTTIKLGGESVNFQIIGNGESFHCEIIVEAIEYIENNIYKKIHNVYSLPNEVIPRGELTPKLAMELYDEYLTSSFVYYVDSKGKPVNYIEKSSGFSK